MSEGASVPARTESGNGWTMHCGDWRNIVQVLDRADNIITDPTYAGDVHAKVRRSLKEATRRSDARNVGTVCRVREPIGMTFSSITEEERSLFGELATTATKRWVIAFCQIEAVGKWREAFERGGLDWVRGGVWRQPDGPPQFTGDRPGTGFECIAIAHRKGRKCWNGGGKHAVWTAPLEQSAVSEHPTQKPVALLLELISDFTSPRETILDPFAGSGTTGVACVRQGRRFVGVEKNPTFFELACERLRAEEVQQSLAARRSGQLSIFEAHRHGAPENE